MPGRFLLQMDASLMLHRNIARANHCFSS